MLIKQVPRGTTFSFTVKDIPDPDDASGVLQALPGAAGVDYDCRFFRKLQGTTDNPIGSPSALDLTGYDDDQSKSLDLITAAVTRTLAAGLYEVSLRYKDLTSAKVIELIPEGQRLIAITHEATISDLV
jgi:hypothetical protein